MFKFKRGLQWRVKAILLFSVFYQMSAGQITFDISSPEVVDDKGITDFRNCNNDLDFRPCDGPAATIYRDGAMYMFRSSNFYCFNYYNLAIWSSIGAPNTSEIIEFGDFNKNRFLIGNYTRILINNYLTYVNTPKPALTFDNCLNGPYDPSHLIAGIWLNNVYQYDFIKYPNNLIGFVHLEYYKGQGREGSAYDHYAIGLCHSTDGGKHWTFCGDLIRPYYWDCTNSTGSNAPNIGGSAYIIQGNYIYLYFNEFLNLGSWHPAVARANLSAVVNCAKEGTVSDNLFHKYHFFNADNSSSPDGADLAQNWTNDAYSTTGNNWGTDLPGLNVPGMDNGMVNLHADAAKCVVSPSYSIYLLAGSYYDPNGGGAGEFLYQSDNGVTWTRAATINRAAGMLSTGGMIAGGYNDAGLYRRPYYPYFVSVPGAGSNDCSIVGNDFYIYYSPYHMEEDNSWKVRDLPISRVHVNVVQYKEPHNITGIATPRTLQLEDFDNGPNGVAYSDQDPVNWGNAYRSTSVDIEPCNACKGYDVGWTVAGEWMNYTCNVAAGIYSISLYAACPNNTNPRVRLFQDNNLITTFIVPNTGDWQKWQAIPMNNLHLSAGSSSVLKVVSLDGGCNLDKLTFTTAANPCVGVQGGGGGLKGTVFGNPSYVGGYEYCRATDGDANTFCDCQQASGGYTGLDLGTAKIIGKIRYYPRSGFSSRMNGGKFQGSNTSESSGFSDLYTISGTPAMRWNEVTITNSTAYRWVRYLSPNNGCCNIAEMEFYTPAVTYQYEAENAVRFGSAGINTNHLGYSGTGFVDGFFNSKEAQVWFNNVNVPSAGTYKLTLHYSAGGTLPSSNTGLIVNNSSPITISYPGTTNWDTWADNQQTVTLKAGRNSIGYVVVNQSYDCINIDYIVVKP